MGGMFDFEAAPPRPDTFLLKIGCLQDDGSSSVAEVLLPRGHAMALAAALRPGGDFGNHFFLANDDGDFRDEDWDFFVDAAEAFENVGSLPLKWPKVVPHTEPYMAERDL